MSTVMLLMRHGETAWNRGKLFRGTFDTPRNETGKTQAGLLTNVLKTRKIDAAYSSPLSRARETAEISLVEHHMEPVIEEGFLDINYGDWTGKKDSDVAVQWPQEHAAWATEPQEAQIPGGEMLQAVFDRAFIAMENIATRHAGQTVAIYAHRVVNKVLVLGALGLGLDRFKYIIQDNCCVNEFVREEAGYIIRSVNNISHIADSGAELLTADF